VSVGLCLAFLRVHVRVSFGELVDHDLCTLHLLNIQFLIVQLTFDATSISLGPLRRRPFRKRLPFIAIGLILYFVPIVLMIPEAFVFYGLPAQALVALPVWLRFVDAIVCGVGGALLLVRGLLP